MSELGQFCVHDCLYDSAASTSTKFFKVIVWKRLLYYLPSDNPGENDVLTYPCALFLAWVKVFCFPL